MTAAPVKPHFSSLAFEDVPQPDHADVVVVPLPARATTDPATWARAIFDVRSTPLWVRVALGLRQVLVPLIGVRPADRDVFDVSRVEGEEALIVADDTHLDFRCAVGVDGAARLVRVTTVVRLHGWRGRAYFVPVRLAHGPVLRAMLRGAARRLG
ncbi:DUF2867 domain-containing protein [Oerskovia jenensis]|uniref:DUF2867 domain-containing protein n=1 Tax=Oerskovia jenensis TaxID=162169 RepID=A0ABS2LEV2_9CELL|nr:DUF2867 domain-containing protein [Oerskovia jenensis]MBM7478668.1 hypothetical protein [Oerskovia jenensis]